MTSSSSTNASSDAAGSAAPLAAAPAGSHRRGRIRRTRLGRALATAGVGLCVAVIGAAPLVAGGVHRPTLILLFAGALASILLFASGMAMQRRAARISAAVLLPALFVLLPLLQSVPLPVSVRRVLDPAGTRLLIENALEPPAAWPMSLDPPPTRVHIGTAAAALVAFVIAFHLASGQNRRHLFLPIAVRRWPQHRE